MQVVESHGCLEVASHANILLGDERPPVRCEEPKGSTQGVRVGAARWTRSPRAIPFAPVRALVEPVGRTLDQVREQLALAAALARTEPRDHVARIFDPARVIDAIHRAGGARPDADLTLLNLAAPLADGQQILVQKKGAATTGGGTGTTTGPGGVAIVNINTADETTLETLNGVGPALAAAIIQYRTEHGAFTSVDQLDDVSGIGPATLEKLRPQVTV